MKSDEKFYIHHDDIEDKFDLGPITSFEFKDALRSMKSNKSGRPDGMSADVYTCIDDTNLLAVVELPTDMWKEEKTRRPDTCKGSINIQERRSEVTIKL